MSVPPPILPQRTPWKGIPAKDPHFTLGRDLSPKGPHASVVAMLTLILPQRTPWKGVPAKDPHFTLGRGLSPKGPLCKCYVGAAADSSSRTPWKSVPAKDPHFTLGRGLSPKGPHANATSMQVPNLPHGRFGKASLPKSLTSP